jgi:hypothetical protein
LLGVLSVLGLASAITLLPAWPFATVPAGVPSFFTSATANEAPYGSVALISPYPSILDVQPQMWQAAAGMRFRMIGGYALVRSALGPSADLPAVLSPVGVQRFLWSMSTGRPGYPLGREPADNTALACATRLFLGRYHVDQVIVTSDGAQPAQVRTLVRRAIGPPSYVGGGVDAWFGVSERVDLTDRSCDGGANSHLALGSNAGRTAATATTRAG